MDVPVGISILAAFIPSVMATVKGSGEVYFDSITMFVAFLLTAGYVEQQAALFGRGLPAQTSLMHFSLPLLTQANRVATLFVLIQLTVTAAVGAAWWVIAPTHAWPVLVSLLVMSCPCALSLAAPVSLAALQVNLARSEPLPVTQQEVLLAQTARITRQNLYGALAWHVLTMPLAALGWVTPWLAALSMFMSSMMVLLNAWRLYPSKHVGLNQAVVVLTQNQHPQA
jgi:hypothetical protein